MSNVVRDSPVVARGAPVRPTPAPPSDEIDLLAYAATCWRYRYVLLAAVVSVAAITYAINKSITPTYEVNFRLLASASKVGDVTAPTVVSVTAFRELLESQSMAAALLEEFKLGEPPQSLTARGFLADRVDVRMIPDTSIISVAVRLNDPQLLVKVANRFAEKAVDLAQRLNVGEGEYATQVIRQELDTAAKRLTAAEQALNEFQHRTQIELLRTDVDTLLMRRPEALDLTVQIEGERGRLRQAEAELAAQERVRNVPRSLASVAPLQPLTSAREAPSTERSSAARDRPGVSDRERPKPSEPGRDRLDPSDQTSRPERPVDTDARPSAGDARLRRPERPSPPSEEPAAEPQFRAELLDPYINPVFEVLQRDVSNARTRLAGLEQQRKELVTRLKLDVPAAETLNRLYAAESGLTALTRDYEVARDAYVNAARRHQEARLQIAVRSARLQILDQALPPDRAVAPRVLRNTAAASLIALTIGIIAVLAFDASRTRALYS